MIRADRRTDSEPSRESWRQRYLTRVVVPTLRLLGANRVDRLARFLVESRPATNHECEQILRGRIARALGVCEEKAGSESIRQIAVLRQSNRMHHARFWAELPFVLALARKGNIRRCLTNPDEIENHVAELRVRSDARNITVTNNRVGVIYASACLGNPVIAALALLEAHGTLTVVADFDQFPITNSWRRYWQKIEGLHVMDRARAVRELPTILDNGGAVFLLADHFRRAGAGVAMSWLGRARTAYRTLGIMAVRHRVPVIPVAAVREVAPMQFQMRLHRHSNTVRDPNEIVRSVLGSLEHGILSAVDQYHWMAAG